MASEVKRCRKHEPVTDESDVWGRYVICKNCGMRGLWSNGQPKFGRPRRIIWLRREFARAALADPVSPEEKK